MRLSSSYNSDHVFYRITQIDSSFFVFFNHFFFIIQQGINYKLGFMIYFGLFSMMLS